MGSQQAVRVESASILLRSLSSLVSAGLRFTAGRSGMFLRRNFSRIFLHVRMWSKDCVTNADVTDSVCDLAIVFFKLSSCFN